MAGTFNPDILVFNAMMADLPMKTGYSPQRWQEGLNVMLEKTPGNFNAEKLRIILLFEADFNSNNKWLGCAVMLTAESLNLLADEQYGNHRNKAAVLQVLNKGLFYDLMRFWKQPAALCSNDAKSCYDPITLLAASSRTQLMLVQSLNISSTKHDSNYTWHESSHMHHVWRFQTISQP